LRKNKDPNYKEIVKTDYNIKDGMSHVIKTSLFVLTS